MGQSRAVRGIGVQLSAGWRFLERAGSDGEQDLIVAAQRYGAALKIDIAEMLAWARIPPDPALQVSLDLGHVSYIATANWTEPLPSPLRDRFRVINFPEPGPGHLDALLAPLIADLAVERNLGSRWIEPLNGQERDAVAAHWRGGSVRQLRRSGLSGPEDRRFSYSDGHVRPMQCRG
jgi:hypothetical protein